MRNIHQRYVRETYDDQGLLETFSVECPPDFNFGYDVVDDIAENDPDRRAMVWCNPEGEEHVFTFGDMKEWSRQDRELPGVVPASAAATA